MDACKTCGTVLVESGAMRKLICTRCPVGMKGGAYWGPLIVEPCLPDASPTIVPSGPVAGTVTTETCKQEASDQEPDPVYAGTTLEHCLDRFRARQITWMSEPRPGLGRGLLTLAPLGVHGLAMGTR